MPPRAKLCAMSHRPFKDRVYGQFSRVGQALASEKRLELLDLLAQGPRHVEALAGETEMSVANVSQHLQVLRAARLVESAREGTRVLYRLADASVLRLWLALREVAETHLAEVEQARREFAADRVTAPVVSRDELEQMLQRGEVCLIDVRPRLEYDHGHLPGALSYPVDDLPGRLEELPRERLIVAYCRGEYCLFADDAVALLRRHGFRVARLDGGWPEWSTEERAVAAGAADHAGR